jgi:predicted protein tyrosine phosphatase
MIRHVHPHVIISITDPPPFGDGQRVDFDLDEDLLDVLHLSFADFHEKHFRFNHDDGRSLKEWAMEPEHGDRVADFLKTHRGNYHTLLIHCEAGVSRSCSMALAIAEHYGIDRRAIEPHWANWDAQPLNPWVYELTKQALEKGK